MTLKTSVMQKQQGKLESVKEIHKKLITELNTQEDVDKFFYKSGASRSEEVIRFDFLQRVFLERVSKRFMLGAVKHGDFNYRKGFNDTVFIRDVINHMQNHLQAYLTPKNAEEEKDDNLAAIGWGVAFLMEYEDWKSRTDTFKG